MKDARGDGPPVEIQCSPRLVATRTADGLVLERRKPVTLIMFSGGVDSTYLLVKFLKETDDEIIVHHVHLLNAEERHVAEARQCRMIVAFCRQHYRPFRYTESAIDHRGLAFFGFDMVTVGFEAGIVAHGFLPSISAVLHAGLQDIARKRDPIPSVFRMFSPASPPTVFLGNHRNSIVIRRFEKQMNIAISIRNYESWSGPAGHQLSKRRGS